MGTANTYFKSNSKEHQFKTEPVFIQCGLNVDETSGIIKHVAVCSVGEAKGHGFSIDKKFIHDVAEYGNSYPAGLKSRFGHPTMSNEALGTYLGRFKNFKVINNSAVADLHLDDVAKKSPGGDLYTWVLEMAKKNPEQFGASIVFKDDGFYQLVEGKEKKVEEYEADPDTPLYIRIKSLNGVDIVDEPAANANGLFSTNFNADQFAVRVSNFLDENPDIWQFIDKNPDKFKPFFKRFSEYKHKKELMKKNKGRSFMQKLAAAITGEDDNTQLSMIDAETTDGNNIRIDAAGDAPAVGDACYVVDPETTEESVAPDADYTIAGGDFDGYKVTVVDGKANAVFNPADKEIEVQQAALQSYKKLQAENKRLQQQMKEANTKLNALQKSFDDFKKNALEEHTIITDDEEPNNTNNDKEFFAKPWNKKAKQRTA